MKEKVNASYNEQYNQVIKQIRDLEKLVEEHEKRTVNGGASWAQLGDLINVSAVLTEVIKFLS